MNLVPHARCMCCAPGSSDIWGALQAEYILADARALWQTSVALASCSAGLQIRWHHLAEEMRVDPHLGSEQAAQALERAALLFLRTALAACIPVAQVDNATRDHDQGSKPDGKRLVLWVAADYRAVYGVVRKLAAQMGEERNLLVDVAHLPADHAEGLRERPGEGGDLSGDNGEHDAALIDLELLSACDVSVT